MLYVHFLMLEEVLYLEHLPEVHNIKNFQIISLVFQSKTARSFLEDLYNYQLSYSQ